MFCETAIKLIALIKSQKLSTLVVKCESVSVRLEQCVNKLIRDRKSKLQGPATDASPEMHRKSDKVLCLITTGATHSLDNCRPISCLLCFSTLITPSIPYLSVDSVS